MISNYRYMVITTGAPVYARTFVDMVNLSLLKDARTRKSVYLTSSTRGLPGYYVANERNINTTFPLVHTLKWSVHEHWGDFACTSLEELARQLFISSLWGDVLAEKYTIAATYGPIDACPFTLSKRASKVALQVELGPVGFLDLGGAC